jgi:hypothetical protein
LCLLEASQSSVKIGKSAGANQVQKKQEIVLDNVMSGTSDLTGAP